MSENFLRTYTEVRVVVTDEEKARTVPLRSILSRAALIAALVFVLVAVVVFLTPGGTMLAAVTAASMAYGVSFWLSILIGLVAWYVYYLSNPTTGRGERSRP